MPYYDFLCKDCNESFELSLSISEKFDQSVEKKCPKCSSIKLKTIFKAGHGGVISKSSKSCDFKGGCGGCMSNSGCPEGI